MVQEKSLIEKIGDKSASVCVVGAGYVGLPTALLFVEKGFHVIAADTSERVVKMTNEGRSHINDPVLNQSVPKAFATGRLKAMQDVTEAAKRADAILISVPTPAENSEPDMRFVKSACESIGKGLRKGTLVVMESTVYPSACRTLMKPALEKASGLKEGTDFFIAHCPERLNPGDNEHAVKITPRIAGGLGKKAGDAAEALYKSVIEAKVHRVSNIDAAELVKLVENTQRDVNIAFMNEVALVCEKIGVDVKEVIEACSTKWNFYKVMPGPGVGGHCLPNNPYYILKRAKEAGVEPRLMMLARNINDSMPVHVVQLVEEAIGDVSGRRIALVGVAYKANVDDVRQAPSRDVAELLRKKGADLVISDPHVNAVNMAKVHGKTVSLGEALESECVVFLCAHDEYKSFFADAKNLGKKIKAKAVIDCVFLFDSADFSGKVYKRVGLG